MMVLTVCDECPEISQIINEHNQAELEKLFNEKCDVNKYVQSVAGNRVNHARALLLAVQEDWEEGVDILIKAGVNISGCVSPVMEAVQRGHTSIALRLLEEGAAAEVLDQRMGLTPLHSAAEQGNVRVVKAVLDSGACEGVRWFEDCMACMTPLEAALGGVRCTKHAVKEMTPPKISPDGVVCNKHAVVKMLVHRGCDVNLTRRNDLSLLGLCSRGGDYVSMAMLLDAGADMSNMTSNTDRTPIMEIIDNDDVTGLKMFIERGADIYARSVLPAWYGTINSLVEYASQAAHFRL